MCCVSEQLQSDTDGPHKTEEERDMQFGARTSWEAGFTRGIGFMLPSPLRSHRSVELSCVCVCTSKAGQLLKDLSMRPFILQKQTLPLPKCVEGPALPGISSTTKIIVSGV